MHVRATSRGLSDGCADAAALRSGHPTAILPVTVSLDPTPVAMVWRKGSAEAKRAVDRLALDPESTR